jgi:hypothetical protein
MADEANDADLGTADGVDGMNEEREDAIETIAQERYDVALAKADGIRQMEQERCDGLELGERGACNDAAEAAYEAAKAAAQAELDAAQAQAERIGDDGPGQ